MQCNYRKCKRERVEGRKKCEHHLDIDRRKTRKLTDSYKKLGCRYCTKESLPGLKVCEKHRQMNQIRCREYNKKLKLEVINRYGDECNCCKETFIEFLTIDHIHNDGAEHRKQKGVGSGSGFYCWLKRNNYPDGFQVLCWNCNAAKSIYGVCPHQLMLIKESKNADE